VITLSGTVFLVSQHALQELHGGRPNQVKTGPLAVQRTAAAESDKDGTRTPKAENVDGEVPRYLGAGVRCAAITHQSAAPTRRFRAGLRARYCSDQGEHGTDG
jgi:hypothetical protein